MTKVLFWNTSIYRLCVAKIIHLNQLKYNAKYFICIWVSLSLCRPFPADLPLINAHKILGILYLFLPSGSQNLRLIECLLQGQRRSSPAASDCLSYKDLSYMAV